MGQIKNIKLHIVTDIKASTMPPNSDAEDYIDIDVDDLQEVEVDDDLPLYDDDEVLGAVEDIELVQEGGEAIDESKIIFELHEASVFSINVAKNDSCLVVTGGEDDKAYVWNYQTAQCLFECTGHTDSVICCDFSMDAKYVMSADMAGNVRVFTTADGQSVWEFQCGDLEWCQWHPSAHVLFAGESSGDVYMWKVPSGDCKIYASHGSKTTCAKIAASGTEIVVGYEDGSLKRWDLKNVNPLFHYKPVTVEGESADPVLCLDLLNSSTNSGNLAVIGTENGLITLINCHTGKQICNFSMKPSETNAVSSTEREAVMEQQADEEEISHAVESVVFSPCGCFVAAGSVNATLCIWDISLQRVRHTCKIEAGLTKLIWSAVEPNIISACLDGVVRLWDHRKGEIVREIMGNLSNILDISLTTDGQNILTAGDDCTARVFENAPITN